MNFVNLFLCVFTPKKLFVFPNTKINEVEDDDNDNDNDYNNDETIDTEMGDDISLSEKHLHDGGNIMDTLSVNAAGKSIQCLLNVGSISHLS